MSDDVRTGDGHVLTGAELAAYEAIARRLSWASLHWRTEKVSPDAWPHIAIAAAAAVRDQVASEIVRLIDSGPKRDDEEQTAFAMRLVRNRHYTDAEMAIRKSGRS